MYSKVHKFATLAKDLNEEAERNCGESKSLKDQLAHVSSERDKLAQEVISLRAAVEHHAKEKAEFVQLKHQLAFYKQREMDRQQSEKRGRQDHLSDLTTRLEKALGGVESDDHPHPPSQTRRRQIIFRGGP